MGALVAFVVWVVMLALMWGLIQGQAQSGALTSVVRVSGLRTVILAGQSALAEASFVLRHPASGESNVLGAILGGSSAGTAHAPVATRELYAADVGTGALAIDDVTYRLVHRGAVPRERGEVAGPWLMDLSVRVTYTLAGHAFTRELRRRHVLHLCQVRAVSGSKKDTVVHTALSVHGAPLVEVVDP